MAFHDRNGFSSKKETQLKSQMDGNGILYYTDEYYKKFPTN